MRLLKKGILMVASNAEAIAKCRDQELEVACKTALEAADELLQQKDAKAIYLQSIIQIQQTELEYNIKELEKHKTKIWLEDPKNTFLLGILSTLVAMQLIR
jgi:hypothetical protein